ncbi:cellulose biosynthesis protein BcsQ [Filimonas zeae]|uniref:Cobyrinic acid a,c-diamide synthase n=1 Tax=Filimonas zeae TaxID=1737353 RepID=A0A917MYX1_9BACT|nr:ParA family protein [Filimonas zeae]MDR6342552.1 cellulose biosynthesis protein BcsQ [Filimonas zeae]GGH81774.1 cobyrinic acid a,c-diamide synthase [Filimonas zeae]
MTSLALYNLKGGVGKTAGAVNLAYLAAAEGWKTLLWDLDPQGSSSFYFDVESTHKNTSKKILTEELLLEDAAVGTSYNNLWVIPADLSARHADVVLDDMKQSKKKLKSLLATLKGYDIVLLDCPPGISLIHDNIFQATDVVLMPNIPTTLSMRSYDTVVAYFQEHGLEADKVKCFFSMVDHRKNLHHEIMQQFYRDKVFLKSYIPYLSDIEKMGVNHLPLFEFANSSYAAQCYRDLWHEIKKILP